MKYVSMYMARLKREIVELESKNGFKKMNLAGMDSFELKEYMKCLRDDLKCSLGS